MPAPGTAVSRCGCVFGGGGRGGRVVAMVFVGVGVMVHPLKLGGWCPLKLGGWW
jgi:hypothetical protein